MKYLSVVVLLLVIGCGQPTKTKFEPDEPVFIEIQGQGDYTHVSSGIELPPEVGDFKRVRMRSYDASTKNISAEYELKSMGFKAALITVYIYPVAMIGYGDKVSLNDHFEQVKKALLDIYPDAAEIAEGTITIGQPWGPVTGSALTFDYKSKRKKEFGKKLCNSRAYLFEHGPWFIKYRITYPKKNHSKVDGKINEFMHSLTWPKLEQKQSDTD
jgi:hypothetical protein